MKIFKILRKKIFSILFILILFIAYFNNELPKNYNRILTDTIQLDYADSLVLSRLNFFRDVFNMQGRSNYGVNTSSKNYNLIQSNEKKESINEQIYGLVIKPMEKFYVRHQLDSGNYSFYFFSGDTKKNMSASLLINGKRKKIVKNYKYYEFMEYKSVFHIDSLQNVSFEIYNNGQDSLSFSSPYLMKRVNRKARRLFWIVIDALRNDIINDSMTLVAPFMNHFAKKYDYFSRVHAPSNATRQSTLSFLTGITSSRISKKAFMRTNKNIQLEHKLYQKFKPINVAHKLSKHGFLSLSFLNNIFFSSPSFGYDLGFQYQFNVNLNSPDEELLSEAMLSYLKSHPSFDSFFFLNTNTSHSRYRSTLLNYIKSFFSLPLSIPDSHYLYYGSVATADEMFEYIVTELKRAKIFHNSKIILHSDHGDHLRTDPIFFSKSNKKGRKSLRHANYFVPQVSYVPLFLSGFTIKERRNETFFLTDLLPTVLDEFNIPYAESDYDSYSLKRQHPHREYKLMGSQMFTNVYDSLFYDGTRDEAFYFDKKYYYQKRDLSLRLIEFRQKEQYKYIQNAVSLKNFLFVDSSIVIDTIHPIFAREKQFYVYKCDRFPLRLDLQDYPKSLKFQRYIKTKVLVINLALFLRNRVDRVLNLNTKDAFYTISEFNEEIRKNQKKSVNIEIEKQLKSWGYIQ